MNENPTDPVITRKADLQALLGTPGEMALNKVIARLDEHCRQFIARSPMLLLSTSAATGRCDVSPRGDKPGFVLVLDANRLVIPERPGNKRFDSLGNILENPQVGLLFLIPGLDETLRINGKAVITRDQALMERLVAEGKTPAVGIQVEVEEGFLHCGKAFKRSGLWDPGTWTEPGQLPKAAAILTDHAKALSMTVDQVDTILQESYEKRLY